MGQQNAPAPKPATPSVSGAEAANALGKRFDPAALNALPEAVKKVHAVIFDSDCGYDDIMAAGCLAKAAPAPVKLVTTVHGMTPNGPHGASSMKKVFTKVGGYAPKVVCGAEGPRKKEHEANSVAKLSWGGEYQVGLQAYVKRELGETTKCYDEGCSIAAIVEILEVSPCDSVDIVAVGPLTNIARLLTEQKTLVKEKVRRVFMMGGALDVAGNVGGDKAELNFYADPDAAATVFSSPILSGRLFVYGLDVCNRDDPRSDEWGKAIAAAQPKGVMSSSQAVNEDTYIYDPLAAYACIKDGKGFEYELLQLEVGPLGDLKRATDNSSDRPIVRFAKKCLVREQYAKDLVAWCGANEHMYTM